HIDAAALKHTVELTSRGESALCTLLEVALDGEAACYFVPLSLVWEDEEERLRLLQPAAVARVRQQANVGLLADAFADPRFCHALLEHMRGASVVEAPGGRLRFSRTPAFGDPDPDLLRTLDFHARSLSSNSTAQLGDRYFLKGFRRLRKGINPELEIGRFLTTHTDYAHAVPIAGALELDLADGGEYTLAVLYRYVANQGDGWDYTLDHLARFLEAQREAAQDPGSDAHGVYLTRVQTLGLRTGQLHLALGTPTGDPAFDPEPVTTEDLSAWHARIVAETEASLARLRATLGSLPSAVQAAAEPVLAREAELIARLAAALPPLAAGTKSRYHGDFHLAQVLLVNDDFVISDFEGEPGRSLEERRAKHSPLRDVAGMLRSFHYAGASALLKAAAQRADDEPRLASLIDDWERAARQAFVDAYASVAVGPERPTPEVETMTTLISLFEIEKACYELRYELDNRPAWALIPLRGILRWVGVPPADAAREEATWTK
ncbi:MAG: putative maltokinase, partial [Gammaproteobacteria bacterium]